MTTDHEIETIIAALERACGTAPDDATTTVRVGALLGAVRVLREALTFEDQLYDLETELRQEHDAAFAAQEDEYKERIDALESDIAILREEIGALESDLADAQAQSESGDSE